LPTEDAGTDVLQDLMTNEQAVKFFGAKPETRQFVKLVRALLIVEVAAGLPVIVQWRIEIIS
jgi:hypothetical protein